MMVFNAAFELLQVGLMLYLRRPTDDCFTCSSTRVHYPGPRADKYEASSRCGMAAVAFHVSTGCVESMFGALSSLLSSRSACTPPLSNPSSFKKKSHHKQVLSYLQTRPSQSQASDSLNSIRRHWVTSVSQLSTPTQAFVRLTIIYVAALWDSSFTNDTRVHARELI